MSNQYNSESPKNEPILKSESARMDTSDSRFSQDKLRQEACKELSSPPDTKPSIDPLTARSFEDRSGEKLLLRGYASKNVDRNGLEYKIENKSPNGANSQIQDPETNGSSSITRIVPDKDSQVTRTEILPDQTTK